MSDEELNNENAIEAKLFEVAEEKLEDVDILEDEDIAVESVEEVNVIVEPVKSEETQALAPVENNTIGSTKTAKVANKPKAKISQIVPEEKVAIFSTSNVTWNGVGKVYRGINIVTAEAADKWLERSHIRTATPEEVAKEYGL
jgi:hypothetical protein